MYSFCGDLSNPADLDLSPLESHRFTDAFGISMPFIEQIGFGASGVVGVWVSTNTKGDKVDLIRAVNTMIDRFLESHGVPASEILDPVPTLSGSEGSKIITDINPYSETRRNRKRQERFKTYRYIRDESKGPALAPLDPTLGDGLGFFEWTRSNEGILPRPADEEMPLENLYGGQFRNPRGCHYGRIRNDLLVHAQ